MYLSQRKQKTKDIKAASSKETYVFHYMKETIQWTDISFNSHSLYQNTNLILKHPNQLTLLPFTKSYSEKKKKKEKKFK